LAKKNRSKETLDYLYSLGRMGIRLGLDSLKKNLSVYKEPQNNFSSILIAGTNGKGSTASMLSHILRASGYKVGLYTSPHLTDFYERITINGEKIDSERFCELAENLKANLKEPLTFFEFVTALALIYFSQEKVDIAVLEVGMGGRLDATNLVTPLLSIITNIGLDHTEFLGRTLPEIAAEKAGIIKPGGTLITAEEKEDIRILFKNVCRKRGSDIFILGQSFNYSSLDTGLHGTSFDFSSNLIDLKSINVPLRGSHQAKNASLALFAALKLSESGYKINEENIRRGLMDTTWRGRLEFFYYPRTILIDCAHNVPGILRLSEFLKTSTLKTNPVNFIYGTLFDKDYCEILKILRSMAKNIILSKPDHPRALHPKIIKERLFPEDNSVKVRVSPLKAFELTKDIAEKDGLICVTGSIFLVADILKELETMMTSEKKTVERINKEYFYLGR